MSGFVGRTLKLVGQELYLAGSSLRPVGIVLKMVSGLETGFDGS